MGDFPFRNLDAQDLWLFGGLLLLGAGTWLEHGLGASLMVVGGVISMLALIALLRRLS